MVKNYLTDNIPITEKSPGDIEYPGYDPGPDVTHWQGPPIPKVCDPLPGNPELVYIAERTWFNGDPWTILRNRYKFILNALDNGWEEFPHKLWELLPLKDWIVARPLTLAVRISEIIRRWREQP